MIWTLKKSNKYYMGANVNGPEWTSKKIECIQTSKEIAIEIKNWLMQRFGVSCTVVKITPKTMQVANLEETAIINAMAIRARKENSYDRKTNTKPKQNTKSCKAKKKNFNTVQKSQK